MLDKKQIVIQLKQVGNLLEVLSKDEFRARAFLNGSQALDDFKGNFVQLYGEKRLEEIRGIGQGLAKEIYASQGKGYLPILEELTAKVPKEVLELFTVSGLGSKKIRLLWQNGIDSVEKLVQAGHDGDLANLKGFGEKSAETILKAARFALESQKRFRLDEATLMAERFVGILRRKLLKARIEVAGSLRRGCETIGDIDVVITDTSFEQVESVIKELTQVESKEPKLKFSYLGYPFEIIVVEPQNFGAALALWTGNSNYKQMLITKAKDKGYQLSAETGLIKNSSKATLDTNDEKILFQQLDIPFIFPELREYASPKVINNLIQDRDIQGVIHNHTTWSDGEQNLSEMVRAAIAKGYRYFGLADHSVTLAIANGLSIDRLHAQVEEVRFVRQNLNVTGKDFGVLHGIEVDILSDGSLAYPDEILAQLDYIIVSVHQGFSLGYEEQTQRIIKAVQNPYVHILGHPTGRLLLKRPPYEVDVNAIIEACADSGTVIEINANPKRLDLDWRYIIKAKELGCKFCISADAHNTNGYNIMPFGVKMARKGGLTKQDVINTAPTADDFLAQLKKVSVY